MSKNIEQKTESPITDKEELMHDYFIACWRFNLIGINEVLDPLMGDYEYV